MTFRRVTEDTMIVKERPRDLVSWWIEAMTYAEFTKRAALEFPRIANGAGARWHSGDMVVGQITDRRVKG